MEAGTYPRFTNTRRIICASSASYIVVGLIAGALVVPLLVIAIRDGISLDVVGAAAICLCLAIAVAGHPLPARVCIDDHQIEFRSIFGSKWRQGVIDRNRIERSEDICLGIFRNTVRAPDAIAIWEHGLAKPKVIHIGYFARADIDFIPAACSPARSG